MKIWAAILLLVPGAPAAAEVEPGKEGNLAEFAKPVPGERICFARSYDAAHLAKHPKQTVSSIRFNLAYVKHDPDQYRKDGQRNYYFQLEVRFRNQPKKAFTTGGDCFPGDGVIRCSVDCDGGGVQVRWQKKPETILMEVGSNGYIRLNECGGGEQKARALRPGADDRTFLLTRMRAEACPLYEKW
jgi:hypothetical protein